MENKNLNNTIFANKNHSIFHPVVAKVNRFHFGSFTRILTYEFYAANQPKLNY